MSFLLNLPLIINSRKNMKFPRVSFYQEMGLAKMRKTDFKLAMCEYLKGKKILDSTPVHDEQANIHLWKSIEYNSNNSDAWECLSNSYWRKKDLVSARNCMKQALDRMPRPKKAALCKMSMFGVWLAPDHVNGLQFINESIKYAQQAVNLDKEEGFCWYVLGSAYQCSFFHTGEWDLDTLLLSANAFEKSNSYEERKRLYPEMRYQWAVVDTSLENYERALTGYSLSVESNPAFDGAKEMQSLIRLLNKLDELVNVKSEGLPYLTSLLSTTNLVPSYQIGNLDLLSEGLNEYTAVIGQVLYGVENKNIFPLYYVLSDSKGERFVVTVHGIRRKAHYQFKSVQVNLVEQFYVNEKAVSFDLAIRKSVRQEIYKEMKRIMGSF